MRKTATVTIADSGRDNGKTFALTEMSATQAEDWALRAFLAMAKGGIEIPPDVAGAGLAGLAKMGFSAMAGMNYADAKPLLDEMMTCVQRIEDPARPGFKRALVENDIEEIGTRLKLRLELFQLHVSFLDAAAP